MEHSGIRVTLVDPRHASEEVAIPVYRVDFWDLERSHSFEHRLERAAGIDEVLAWAEAHRGGSHVVVWAEYRNGDSTGLLRLLGCEPGAA